MAGGWVGLHDRPVHPPLSRMTASITTGPVPAVVSGPRPRRSGPGIAVGSAARKGCAVAAQPSGKAAPELPLYLRAAEVADILHGSAKAGWRWARGGEGACVRGRGGDGGYAAAEIRQLA